VVVFAFRSFFRKFYDVYLNLSSRTIDGHYKIGPREYIDLPGRPLPFQPASTVDGKVVDSEMAGKMSFWARWRSICGMPFYAEKFLKKYIQ